MSTSRMRRVFAYSIRMLLLIIVLSVGAAGMARIAGRERDESHSVAVPDGPVLSVRRVATAAGLAISVGDLGDRIAADFARGVLASTPSCVDVRTSDGAHVYSKDAGDLKAIASNTKLFLTAASLLRLGSGNRFRTVVAGTVDSSGRATDALYLVGGGDPFLSTLEFKAWEEAQEVQRPTTSLADLADAVVAAGVKSAPQVIGDASVFDTTKVVATHSRDLLAQKVIPPLSGLSVNRNIEDWATAPKNNPAFFDNPAAAAANELTRLLRERGVRVDRSAGSGTAPDGVGAVAAVESVVLAETVKEINEESDNFAAEMLLKHLGAAGGEGSTARGVTIMLDELAKLGLPSGQLELTDGSGLSRNAASCGRIADLLVMMEQTTLASDFIESLAAAGETGTLKKRFTEAPLAGALRAKTGSLSDVSALSGYLGNGDPRLVFAYVINVPKSERVRYEAEDAMAQSLVGFPMDGGPPPLGGTR